MLAVDPRGAGVLGKDKLLWRVNTNAPNKPSPVLVDGHIYMVSDGGWATCLDAKTGAEVWKQRVKGNFSASMIAGDGKIYMFSEGGITTVIAPGREFKLLAENKVDEQGVMASPAVDGKALFIRTKSALYRIEN